MLNSELLADLGNHKRALQDSGFKSDKVMNAMLDRFLRDFADNSNTLVSMSGGGTKYTNYQSLELLNNHEEYWK